MFLEASRIGRRFDMERLVNEVKDGGHVCSFKGDT